MPDWAPDCTADCALEITDPRQCQNSPNRAQQKLKEQALKEKAPESPKIREIRKNAIQIRDHGDQKQQKFPENHQLVRGRPGRRMGRRRQGEGAEVVILWETAHRHHENLENRVLGNVVKAGDGFADTLVDVEFTNCMCWARRRRHVAPDRILAKTVKGETMVFSIFSENRALWIKNLVKTASFLQKNSTLSDQKNWKAKIRDLKIMMTTITSFLRESTHGCSKNLVRKSR